MSAHPGSTSLASAKTSTMNSRRIAARLLDALILTGLTILLTHLVSGTTWLMVSLWVTVVYFFVLEAVFGQTVGKLALGLRVVRRDGGPPNASALAIRNVIRIFEEPVIALLVLFGSRSRRQRLGDFAAGTTVGIERASVRPYPSPLWIIYPALWAVLGALLMVLPHHSPDRPTLGEAQVAGATALANASYLRQLQTLCRDRDYLIRTHWHATGAFVLNHERAFTRQLAAVPAPPSMQGVRQTILFQRHRSDRVNRVTFREMARRPVSKELYATVYRPRLIKVARAANWALRDAGLVCSTGEGPLP
jgi:uncharacterized RDD family membrane protein YckC